MSGTWKRRTAGAGSVMAPRRRVTTDLGRAPAGLVGVHSARAAARGADTRELLGERPGTIGGVAGGAHRLAVPTAPPVPPTPVGRGTAAHRQAVRRAHDPRGTNNDDRLERVRRGEPARAARRTAAPVWPRSGTRRRVAVAGLAALLLLAGAAGTGLAQAAPRHYRYVVQPGDTLESVAASFGVDPAAILAASAVDAPPALTPAEVVIIPDPTQSPAEAAATAAEREGTSPWVAGVHVVAAGETLADIAAGRGVSTDTLAGFNGLADADIDAIDIGQRLLVPPAPGGIDPAAATTGSVTPAWVVPGEADLAAAPAAAWSGSFVPGVPTYVQGRNLSCEYAAAFIATSTFGAGVPEWAFLETVPLASNPHQGFRGDIDGWWGNTDDYGVYPEALVPTLNANGYGVDVLYTGGDPAPLRDEIDAGRPVAVWLGYRGDTGFYETGADGTTYTLAAGYHVVVVYGYDEAGVYFSDPARGEYGFFAWDNFTTMWRVLDGMAMAVFPA